MFSFREEGDLWYKSMGQPLLLHVHVPFHLK